MKRGDLVCGESVGAAPGSARLRRAPCRLPERFNAPDCSCLSCGICSIADLRMPTRSLVPRAYTAECNASAIPIVLRDPVACKGPDLLSGETEICVERLPSIAAVESPYIGVSRRVPGLMNCKWTSCGSAHAATVKLMNSGLVERNYHRWAKWVAYWAYHAVVTMPGLMPQELSRKTRTSRRTKNGKRFTDRQTPEVAGDYDIKA